VRLRPLEYGVGTGSQSPVGEDMLDRVHGAGSQERRPAAPQEQVDGSGDARHPGCPLIKPIDKERKGKEWTKMCLQVSGFQAERFRSSPSPKIFGVSRLVSQEPRASNWQSAFAGLLRSRAADEDAGHRIWRLRLYCTSPIAYESTSSRVLCYCLHDQRTLGDLLPVATDGLACAILTKDNGSLSSQNLWSLSTQDPFPFI